MQNQFSDEEIIAMCAAHEDCTNVREVDRKFYVEFWEKAVKNRDYCGRQGLWTIIKSYVDKKLLKPDATEEERDILIKQYQDRLPDWRDKYKPYY